MVEPIREEHGQPTKTGIYLNPRNARQLRTLMAKLHMGRSQLMAALIEQEHEKHFGKE